MRVLMFLLVMLGASHAMADSFHRQGLLQVAAQEYLRSGTKGVQDPTRSPRVHSEQAVAQVKRAFADYKILSIQLVDSAKGSPVYRVKTLTPKGIVKYIYVDGQSGDVFE